MVRFGIIGAGSIARTFCEAIKAVEGASLYAVASRDHHKAKQYQTTYAIEKAYGSYEAMLADPLVDCVYIATPHGLHYEHMMQCLDYDKHILCEKAFTLNEHQANAVFAKARERDRFVMEAMWTRFLPVIQTIKRLVDEGRIGAIKTIHAALCFDLPVDEHHRVLAKHLGGGALLDVGIYPLTFAHLFLGNPKSFEASMTVTSTEVDASNQITYDYDQARAYLKSSVVEHHPTTAVIEGTCGTITVPTFWCASRAELHDADHQLIETFEHPHEVNGFEYEIREVVHCLNNGLKESATMSHQTTRELMRQMDAIRNVWQLRYPQET